MEHSARKHIVKGLKGSNAPKKPRAKPKHPPTSKMVNNAIKSFEEHHHKPSLLDIKNFISANYKIDVEKLSPFIKKYLNDAVTGGKLIQTNDDSSCDKYESAQRKELKASAQKVMKRRPASTSDKKTKVVAPVKPDFTDLINDLEQRHAIEIELLRQLNLANEKISVMQEQLRLMDSKNKSLEAELAKIKK